MKYIAIMGLGTIGRGVYELICENRDILKERLGEEVRVKRILDLRDFPGDPVQDLITHDVSDVIDDPSISIVVETMGGVEPAFSFEMRALNAGKHVCTSNKELVEKKGAELLLAARKNNVNFFFEASVGGGIPIIRNLAECLTADKILSISGILNGTTNYILSSMADGGVTYEAALLEAQKLGFAERNPEADVEGYDAGRKIAILASMVTGKNVSFEDITVEGISDITEEDIRYASELGCAIKLIAEAVFEEDGVFALVAPRMVGRGDALYSVNNVFNAVTVCGNMVGDVMLYGQGAGARATSSAVCADVFEAIKRGGETVYAGWSDEKATVKDISGIKYRYFVRVLGSDQSAYENALKAFSGGGIAGTRSMEFGLITEEMTEAEFLKRSSELNGFIKGIRIKGSI